MPFIHVIYRVYSEKYINDGVDIPILIVSPDIVLISASGIELDKVYCTCVDLVLIVKVVLSFSLILGVSTSVIGPIIMH